MATFKISVFKHQQRADGKYPVSIRVYWRRKYGYVGTEYYVTIHQISQNKRKGTFELKDSFIIAELTRRIELFEKEKLKLGLNMHKYSAPELARHFESIIERKGDDDSIDFIKFGKDYIEKETKKGRNVSRICTTLNALIDFAGDKLPVRNLTSKYLKSFEDFLRTERTITRTNQFRKEVKTIERPLSDVSIRGYMTDIRTVFNMAIDTYNEEEKDVIRISHYPFRRYKLPSVPETGKRNISKDDILKIVNITDDELVNKRAILARDVFIISFLFIGMNLRDLYELETSRYENGRITYQRAKTRDRRKDNARISIKVGLQAKSFLEKYRDYSGRRLFDFYLRYTTPQIFLSNINSGLKTVARKCGIEVELSSYYARHSWATIARNKCKISKSDIDECLNHVDPAQKMADVYIEKDWSFIDKASRKVISYVFGV
jgi:integrase